MRAYEDSDYETIKSWWELRGDKAPSNLVLSDDGLIIEGVAASWLYTGNSTMALIGWPVVNPKVGCLTAMRALEQILREQAKFARVQGCLVVSAYTNAPALLKLMDKIGFRRGDDTVTNMILGV